MKPLDIYTLGPVERLETLPRIPELELYAPIIVQGGRIEAYRHTKFRIEVSSVWLDNSPVCIVTKDKVFVTDRVRYALMVAHVIKANIQDYPEDMEFEWCERVWQCRKK